MSIQLYILYGEAWLLVALGAIAGWLCLRHGVTFQSPRRIQRFIQGTACLWLSVIYSLRLMGHINLLTWAYLSTPGLLVLMAVLISREVIGRNDDR